MIKREQNKPSKLAQNDSNSKADREIAKLAAQVAERDALFGDSYLLRLKRKERKAPLPLQRQAGIGFRSAKLLRLWPRRKA